MSRHVRVSHLYDELLYNIFYGRRQQSRRIKTANITNDDYFAAHCRNVTG